MGGALKMRKYCFSTEVVDLDNQAPNRNKRESKYFWDELNHLIRAGGFDSIEIPYEPKWDFGGRSGIPRTLRSITTKFETVAGYMEFLKANGIDSIDCVHMNPSIFCQGALPMYFGAFEHFASEAVSFAAEAGCRVVSLSVTPQYYRVHSILGDRNEEDFLQDTKAVIARLSEQMKKTGGTLCLKNEYWGLLRGEKITAFLDQLDADVMLDLDTANLAAAGADIDKVIRENAGRIGIVHLTDTSFEDRDETWKTALPEFPANGATKVFADPGFGRVDLKAVISSLEEAGYQGIYVFNPRNSYDISRSILRSRYYIDSQINQ